MLESTLSCDMSSGVADMDQLHFDFFEAIGTLIALPEKKFPAGFHTLVRHAEQTFAKEEEWMDEVDFAADKSHREQHAHVLGALHYVHSRVMDGELAIGRETIETLLPQWLVFHISTMDVALAAAMQMHEFTHRAIVLPQSTAHFQQQDISNIKDCRAR